MDRNSTSSLKDLLLKSFNTICKTKLQNTKLCRSERAMTSKVFTNHRLDGSLLISIICTTQSYIKYLLGDF